MTLSRRIAVALVLAFACLATYPAGDYLRSWANAFIQDASLARSLTTALIVGLWALPLLLCPKLRDIGTLRLPWSWTVFLILPYPLLNLFFWGGFPHENTWAQNISSVWVWFALGMWEELVFRGYALRGCNLQPRLAIFISSLAFSLVHLSGRPVLVLVIAFFFGIGAGIIRVVSGSLGWCIVLHGVTNAAAEFIRPFNGPLFIITYALCAIAAMVVFWTHPKLRSHSALSV